MYLFYERSVKGETKIERRHFILENNMNVFDKKGQAVQIESNVVFLYLY